MGVKDLTGNRVGKLILLERKRENNRTYYYCKCDCGNEKWMRADVLSRGATSCGCERTEKLKQNHNLYEAHINKNIKLGTNIALINNPKTKSINKSGVTGICWDKKRCKWVAQIQFKNKMYNLGRFDDKEDAIAARKEAEERFFKPVTEKLNKRY